MTFEVLRVLREQAWRCTRSSTGGRTSGSRRSPRRAARAGRSGHTGTRCRGGGSRRVPSFEMLVEVLRVSGDLLRVARADAADARLAARLQSGAAERARRSPGCGCAACASSPGSATRRRPAGSTGCCGGASIDAVVDRFVANSEFTRRELLAARHRARQDRDDSENMRRRAASWGTVPTTRRSGPGRFSSARSSRRRVSICCSTRSRSLRARGMDATLDIVGAHRRLGGA